ncbi:MAG: toprim domain-containing protein [Anaerolineae bacterium]|nr:toprim domain-containing protein [Anaerolineae bacterium]
MIVVEGPLDLAALVRWRLHESFHLLALLGTDQVKAIALLTQHHRNRRIFIATDQDKAGCDAAQALADCLIERGLHPSVLRWPNAKDCGELLQQGRKGEDTFRFTLDEAQAKS